MSEQSNSETNYDMFLSQKLYPDAKALLTHEYRNIEDIIGECDIVLDTNVLLIPYLTGSNSFNQFKATYEKLNGRIFIPAQVAREFAKNRSTKLTDLYSNLSNRKSNIGKPSSDYHPILEQVAVFSEFKEAEDALIDAIKKYQKAITKIQEEIRSWSLNDPVSKLYRELFGSDSIWDVDFNEDETKRQLEYRYENKIPPGYKDASKNDKGIGDLLIWKSILDIGKQRQKHLIFVTGEEKSDWQHRSEKRGLFPRYELVDEYRRASGEKTFHIASLSKLLELFEADTDVIKEVREYELSERQRKFDALIEVQLYRELQIDDPLDELIECPYCGSVCETAIRPKHGSSSKPRCSHCNQFFHAHRDRDGSVYAKTTRIPLPHSGEKEQVLVDCPDCGNPEISVFLGVDGGSSSVGFCDLCDKKFHVHRHLDGSYQTNSW